MIPFSSKVTRLAIDDRPVLSSYTVRLSALIALVLTVVVCMISESTFLRILKSASKESIAEACIASMPALSMMLEESVEIAAVFAPIRTPRAASIRSNLVLTESMDCESIVNPLLSCSINVSSRCSAPATALRTNDESTPLST